MNSSYSDMCEGPIFKKIVFYTVPIILTSLLQLLFNAADLVVVGRFCGSVSVGAVGATGALINLIINLFIGLSVGAGVRTAQALGSGDYSEVHNTIHTSIPAALISGIVLTFIGLFCSRFLLDMMDTPDDVIGLSTIYMQIYFCGITSSMVYNFGSAILRAAGDTKGPLIYLTIAGVVNVILNVFFVVVFRMDVAGVALATSISQTLSAVLVVIALTRRPDACRLHLRQMKINLKTLAAIMRVGIPAGLQSSMFSISNVIIQSSINSFGSVAMSGNAAAGNIEGFVYVSMNAFHQTALNFTGQNFGARRFDRIKKITLTCLGCVASVGLILGVSVCLVATPLLSIYITDSPAAIEYGIIRMMYICLPYFLCGIMDVTTGLMRGMGVSFAPMLITVLGVCGFRIGWIYTVFLLPEYHTLPVLYLSYPISWLATFVVELIVFIMILRRYERQNAVAPISLK